MQVAQFNQPSSLQPAKLPIVVTATFTAEPIEEILLFWMQQLGYSSTIEFAPYNQVFQQLLDPVSLITQNQKGINIILLRFEDWFRFEKNITQKNIIFEQVERNVKEFISALKLRAIQTSTLYIICFCPPSPNFRNEQVYENFWQKMEGWIISELESIANLYWINEKDFQTYPVQDYYDQQRDKLGHIPFTQEFFTALGTVIARKIYRLRNSLYKVIVLDCDNTLWKGIVGEDGVEGVGLSEVWQTLQKFILTQKNAGMIICLCSKNNEADVIEVFEQRLDMILKLDDIVAWRINWLPKSENIKALAQELNLGLDSFLFIDDNPLECAEVTANCPDVLTLTLPLEDNIPQFIQHIWAFDHLKITDEDKQRTNLYKQNVERNRFQQETSSIEAFLAGLNLNIQINSPKLEQISRIAQLTQRTNQFNCTTIRRTEAEIGQLTGLGLECRGVEVCDRFGDYGLVGVIIFSIAHDSLVVDTFLLSCRVLGRGVEHGMVNTLAEIAKERNLSWVKFPYFPTKKNLPALNFLESIGKDYQEITDKGYCFTLPVDYTATLAYRPMSVSTEVNKVELLSSHLSTHFDRSACLNRIATELYNPKHILQVIKSQQPTQQRTLAQPLIAPQTDTEKQLIEIWQNLLFIEAIGIQDNYFDLGGTSLQAVELFAQIENIFAKKLPLTTLLETPTIEQLAQRIQQTDTKSSNSLILLRDGETQPPLFLIHDGDGETLLYRNLAHHLTPARSVYGIQPYSKDGYPMLHTRIEEMATYYIEQIRTIQPEGIYLLGGMCAGGVIAFEVARQLQILGQTIGLVAIIDAADVEVSKKVGRISSQRLNRFTTALGENKSLSYLFKTITQKVRNVITYELATKIQKIIDKVRMKLLRYYRDRSLPLPKFLQNISVRTVYVFAEKDYLPDSLYQGEVTLFRAISGQGADEAYINIYNDPLLGWGKRVTKGVKIFDIPGGHSSMLQEPNVSIMSQKMQAYIEGVAGVTGVQN